MALQLTSVITNGLRRTVSRTGAILFASLVALQLLLMTSLNTVIASVAPAEMTGQVGLALPISQTVAGVLLIGTYILLMVYAVVAARGLARPLTDLGEFPSTLYTRRLGRATLSMLAGLILLSVAVMIGFVFLIIPGLVLSACFLCFIFTVGVEDRGPIAGLKRSWALARGNRLRLVALVVLIGLLSGVVGFVPTVVSAVGSPAAGTVVTVLINSLLLVPVYGMIAAVYLQLTTGSPASPSGGFPSASPSEPSTR